MKKVGMYIFMYMSVCMYEFIYSQLNVCIYILFQKKERNRKRERQYLKR